MQVIKKNTRSLFQDFLFDLAALGESFIELEKFEFTEWFKTLRYMEVQFYTLVMFYPKMMLDIIIIFKTILEHSTITLLSHILSGY